MLRYITASQRTRNRYRPLSGRKYQATVFQLQRTWCTALTIQRFEPSQPYELMAVKSMDITAWLFHPNIDAISMDLQNLYADLKDYATFTDKADWINYYINRLAPIYQKQSQQDSLMSQSFDFFFQMKDEYITGHIPNTHNVPIKFKEISSNSQSI